MPPGPEVKKKMDATEGLTDFMFLQPLQFLELDNTFKCCSCSVVGAMCTLWIQKTRNSVCADFSSK